MKWKNSKIEGVPKEGEQVLIAIHGIYFVAVYNTEERKFTVLANGQSFWIDVDPVSWQPIDGSGDGKEKTG
jgi:hypothetical protein